MMKGRVLDVSMSLDLSAVGLYRGRVMQKIIELTRARARDGQAVLHRLRHLRFIAVTIPCLNNYTDASTDILLPAQGLHLAAPELRSFSWITTFLPAKRLVSVRVKGLNPTILCAHTRDHRIAERLLHTYS